MKVLFIGGTKRGYMTLKAMLEHGVTVSGVVSLLQDEHEVERYERHIEDLARKHSVQHYLTKSMTDRDYADLIASEIKPDIAFVVGCRILIPERIYRIPRLGMLAVHDSLLPEYRGFAPLNWAVINGEKKTGVTLFYLDERMDGGDIAGQKGTDIAERETAPQVYERICQLTVDVVLETCERMAQGTATRTRQDYDAGSFTCSRTPEDGMIDWNRPTLSIDRQVRALTHPYPGAFTYYRNEKLVVWTAEPVRDARRYAGRIPGRVIGISKADGHVDVLTADGILRMLEVQLEGGERAPAARVIGSVRVTLGVNVAQLLHRIREMERKLNTDRGGESS